MVANYKIREHQPRTNPVRRVAPGEALSVLRANCVGWCDVDLRLMSSGLVIVTVGSTRARSAASFARLA
jgi:hypothetical protein